MATLNRLSGYSIAKAISPVLKNENCDIYVSGGGMHNPLLMEYIQQELPGVTIRSTAEKNINPDAKEAILFAILANECVAGNNKNFPDDLPNFPNVSMGKISFPG